MSPAQLKAALRDGEELALVDVREQGVYFRGHLLFAVCIPLSHLEMRVADLVPRRSVRMVICDAGDDDDLAVMAARKLRAWGYTDVSVLDGGVRGWREAGYEVFSGVNVPSKAFGEYIEHRYETPRLSAEELAARSAAGDNLVILDSRPMEEFHNVSIPGGTDCPGAELVYRVFDMAPDPETLVVVNCAGRTRSIIGAQSLINAGIPNRVMALKNGTMGWELAGLKAARGETRHAPAPSETGLRHALAAADRVARRFDVNSIDEQTLHHWQAQADQRTLHILDVRTPEEFAAGHRPDSRHAPGGQLVQATDEYIATRHARIVLVDNDGVRATMTASWLLQMGWRDAHVLRRGLQGELVRGSVGNTLLAFRAASLISVDALHEAQLAGSGPAVLDVGSSLKFRRGHIPGAYWGVRTRLMQALERLPAGKPIVVTSPDGLLAQYVAQDLSQIRPDTSVRTLAGGTAAWIAAGLTLESGDGGFTCEPDDVWYKPYEQPAGIRDAMQGYLTWEVNLVEQIKRDGDAVFS